MSLSGGQASQGFVELIIKSPLSTRQVRFPSMDKEPNGGIAMAADVYSHASVTMQKMAMEKWNTAFKRDGGGAQKTEGL